MTLEEDIRSEENIRKEDVAKRFRHVSFPKFTNLTLYTSEVVDEFEVLQGPHVYDFLARRVRCDKCGKPTGWRDVRKESDLLNLPTKHWWHILK